MTETSVDPTTTTTTTAIETDASGAETATERALARIAVQPPYFALTDLVDIGPGLVTARLPGRAPSYPETGPVEAAQVARHLAILGSCGAALARGDDKRHHYLATSAHYMRLSGGPATLDGLDHLEAQAVATWIDKRTARANVKLVTPDGVGTHVLDVEYSVLTPRMFGRLQPSGGRGPERNLAPSPPPDGDGQTEPIDGGLRLDLGPVPSSWCEGHFPDHPAAPVAIVMGQLCRLAGRCAIEHGDGATRYRIEQGHVTASGLAAAGQRLVLEVRYGHRSDGGHGLHGRALADDEEVGRVDVTVSTWPAPSLKTAVSAQRR